MMGMIAKKFAGRALAEPASPRLNPISK